MRILLLLHRYLGILLGLLISVWCLSAFVMMYVRFPVLSFAEELGGLQPIDLSGCCRMGELLRKRAGPVGDFRIEMLAGRPVLRFGAGYAQPATIDLSTGRTLPAVEWHTARRAASGFLRQSGIADRLVTSALVERDQWTVNGRFDRHRPLYRFGAGDADRAEIYVSSATGQVVQQSTAHERFWNWLGAVAHWMYPTVLRQHPAVWHYSVVLTSAGSLFLIGIGIYIGWRQYRARYRGRNSPYKGAALWHHYGGLAFGVLALAWTFSGLLSMNPLGLLQSDAGISERKRLAGMVIGARQIADVVNVLGTAPLPASTVRIESAAFAGSLALVAWQANGDFVRLGMPTLRPEPLSASALRQAVAIIAAGRPDIVSAGLIEEEDPYYFSHHEAAPLPVYRIVVGGAGSTRYYLHPGTGRLLFAADNTARWFRWLFQALHRGDFSRFIRQRPLWDVFMLTLLAGVTVSSITGTYMGFRRLQRRKPHRRDVSKHR